jgi:hypothetical protein
VLFRSVIEDDRLTMSCRFIYSVIDGLEGEDGCWASNAYIAQVCSLSGRQVQNVIKRLVEFGYVIRVVSTDGKRTLRTVAKVALLAVKGGEADFVGGVKPASWGGVKPTSPNSIDKIEKKDKPTLTLPFDSEAFKEAWGKWVAYRKERGSPLKPTTIAAQFKAMAGAAEVQAIAAIEKSIFNGWQGLFLDQQQKGIAPKRLTSQDYSQGF